MPRRRGFSLETLESPESDSSSFSSQGFRSRKAGAEKAYERTKSR
jgi:hypothetical protein